MLVEECGHSLFRNWDFSTGRITLGKMQLICLPSTGSPLFAEHNTCHSFLDIVTWTHNLWTMYRYIIPEASLATRLIIVSINDRISGNTVYDVFFKVFKCIINCVERETTIIKCYYNYGSFQLERERWLLCTYLFTASPLWLLTLTSLNWF